MLYPDPDNLFIPSHSHAHAHSANKPKTKQQANTPNAEVIVIEEAAPSTNGRVSPPPLLVLLLVPLLARTLGLGVATADKLCDVDAPADALPDPPTDDGPPGDVLSNPPIDSIISPICTVFALEPEVAATGGKVVVTPLTTSTPVPENGRM